MAIEQTLILAKADAVARGLAGEIIARLERRGYTIAALKLLMVDEKRAKTHYAEHEGKPFFAGLVEYLTSAPLVAMVIEGNDAIEGCRATIGATNPIKAAPGSIRADYGQTIGRNLVHGSDSAESASALRSAGNSTPASPVTTSDPMPPITTARTVPHHCAVKPLSNPPNSFDAPTNSQFTALTRPRISGGVASCKMLARITTLTISLAPTTTNANRLTHIVRDKPNTIVAVPKIPTQNSISLPASCLIGRTVITSDTASAPTAGIARRIPKPQGPVCRMSFA